MLGKENKYIRLEDSKLYGSESKSGLSYPQLLLSRMESEVPGTTSISLSNVWRAAGLTRVRSFRRI